MLGSSPCACAARDHVIAVLPKSLMNSRLMGFSLAEIHLLESLIRSSNESYTLHRSAVGGLMSVSGQTRTLDNVRVTSVKLLIADSKRTFSYVRSGPQTDTPLKRIREFVRQKIPGLRPRCLFFLLRSTNSRAHYAVLTRLRSQRVRLMMLPAGDRAGNRRAEDGRQPEQPELRDIGSAGKQRRAGAARRID
jgi:hypothetical protein